jgi:hypothetical protein
MQVDFSTDAEWIKQEQLLKDKIASERASLYSNLQNIVNEAMAKMPKELVEMNLEDFLCLLSIYSAKSIDNELDNAKRKRKQTILGLDMKEVNRLTMGFPEDSGRRLTRSMAAKLRQQTLVIGEPTEEQKRQWMATPRLHPGLPETPAIIRQAIKEEKSGVAPAQAKANPIRIAGSTIRATNIIHQDQEPPTPLTQAKRTKMDKNTKKMPENDENSKAANPLVSNLIHMELSDGKILDVDLTQSPGTIFKGMEKEKTSEVKQWLSQYANSFTNFLKRLGA